MKIKYVNCKSSLLVFRNMKPSGLSKAVIIGQFFIQLFICYAFTSLHSMNTLFNFDNSCKHRKCLILKTKQNKKKILQF